MPVMVHERSPQPATSQEHWRSPRPNTPHRDSATHRPTCTTTHQRPSQASAAYHCPSAYHQAYKSWWEWRRWQQWPSDERGAAPCRSTSLHVGQGKSAYPWFNRSSSRKMSLHPVESKCISTWIQWIFYLVPCFYSPGLRSIGLLQWDLQSPGKIT